MENCTVSDTLGYRIVQELLSASRATTPRNHLLDLNDGILFRWACSCGNLRLVSFLLESGADPTAFGNDGIQWAVIKGHAAVVALLLQKHPQVDPSSDHDFAVRSAAAMGHAEVLALLLTDARVDAGADDNNALRTAAALGHARVLGVLLSLPPARGVDPGVFANCALWSAAKNGHADAVAALLADPRVDPAAEDSRALRIAARNGHSAVVRVLLNDERVDVATAAAVKRESLFSFIGSLFWPSVN
ncbi:ankyrin repeat-containing domain protein [Obelidium mucronatum]|nr:ankyrin repeat-containing domain protein [Obelidium mucronatum]